MPAHAIEQNGIAIARTPTGVGVGMTRQLDNSAPLLIEVDYQGKRLKADFISPIGPPWRDYFGKEIDHLKCVVRVWQGVNRLCELSLPDEEYPLPFMVRQGPQLHVTENFVSVPPALHITDSVGAIWTLGFRTAHRMDSPDGEFAFNVLRDGVDQNEVASRIEKRNGQIKIFTRHGWKKWNGRTFI